MRVSSFLIILLLIAGCAAPSAKQHYYGLKFFGVRMDQDASVEDLVITGYTGEGVQFKANAATMRPEITGLTEIERDKIRIEINNRSQSAIRTHAKADWVLLKLSDGTAYKLGNEHMLSAPRAEPIRAGQKRSYLYRIPKDLNPFEIRYVAMHLGLYDSVMVVMKPLPTKAKETIVSTRSLLED